MSVSPRDIDRIVREVLTRLGAALEAKPSSTRATKPSPMQTGHAEADPTTVRITAGVVTLADVGPRLGRAKQLVVPPGAVVTPAVRDLLRDREITLCYTSDESSACPSGARLTLVIASDSFNPGPVVEVLHKEGLVVEPTRSDCLIETFDRLAEAAGRGETLGVVLTSHVAAALCLGNRLAGLRAVTATEPASAVEAARAVGANVLVACPRGAAPYRLGQMIVRFVAEGPYPCPDSLRDRLK